MGGALEFGVQSYCFRHFVDNAGVAEKVKEIGVDRIEVCNVHGDFSNPEAFVDVANTYRDAGVSIVSIGVETFSGLDSDRSIFECASIAGASHISCHFQVDTFTKAIPQVRAWCREFGIRAGIHSHGGYHFGGQPVVLKHLVGLGGPEIGLCIDTAWALQIGPNLGNPVQWVKDFPGQTYGVHYKDFVFDRDARWHDTVVGQGTLDLKGFVAALEEDGFDGMAVIEYEADVENPVPALTECVQAMRDLVG